MTTSLTSSALRPCGRSHGARQVVRFGMSCGALATLLLTAGTPAAIADPVPNRVFAECVLSNTSTGQQINTIAGLQADILRTNTSNPNDPEIETPVVAYVVIYAINNDNNGQRIVDGRGGPLLGFTGPVICRNPNVNIASVLQTTDIPDVDILDIQDALILRHTPTGALPAVPDANRLCHTTDGNTDCFNLQATTP